MLSVPSNVSVTIATNNLKFSNIIPNLVDENDNPREDNFIYIPQRLLDTRDILSLKIDDSITLSVSSDHQDNIYQWYKDGEQIENATSEDYVIDSTTQNNTADYWAILTNPNLLSLELQRNTITLVIIPKDTTIINDTTKNDTTIVDDTIPITDIQSLNTKLFAYPNPVAKELHIKHQGIQEYTISITDNNGIIVLSKTIVKTHAQEDYILNVESLPSGVYHLQLKEGNLINISTMIKE